MKLHLFLLAEYAQVKHGRFNIVGGGVGDLAFRRFPAQAPSLCLAIRLSADRADAEEGFAVSIDVISPSGLGLMPAARLDIWPAEEGARPDQEFVADFVFRLPSVVLPEAGRYEVRLGHGDAAIGSLSFTAHQEPSLTAPVATVRDAKLAAGYDAFRKGDVDAAEALFREVVHAAEYDPTGHNNLGFVLLCKREFEAALEQLQRARELDYSDTEILQVNIACCHYGLGRWPEAAEEFAACLELPSPVSGVLCAVDRDALCPVTLSAATHYVALVSLNLAWTYARIEKPRLARRHAEVARRLTRESHVDDCLEVSLVHLDGFNGEVSTANE